MGSNPILSAIGNRINPVFMRFFHAYIAKEQGMKVLRSSCLLLR